MYGSWLTVLLFTIGCIVGLFWVIKFIKIYYSLYLMHKGKNEIKASMFKELLLNSFIETLFFILIIGFVLVALLYKPEVFFVGY